MKTLPRYWFAEHPLDFEYKQYVLLDFLQGISGEFDEMRLYPALKEVNDQIHTMETFLEGKERIDERMRDLVEPAAASHIAPQPGTGFEVVFGIADFALKKLSRARKRGAAAFERASSQIEWETVGIVPRYVAEGYIILHMGKKQINIYKYNVRQFIVGDEPASGINMEIIDSFFSRLCNYEDIKLNLMKERPELPVPMTFAVKCPSFPLDETVLPIIKRVGLAKIYRQNKA